MSPGLHLNVKDSLLCHTQTATFTLSYKHRKLWILISWVVYIDSLHHTDTLAHTRVHTLLLYCWTESRPRGAVQWHTLYFQFMSASLRFSWLPLHTHKSFNSHTRKHIKTHNTHAPHFNIKDSFAITAAVTSTRKHSRMIKRDYCCHKTMQNNKSRDAFTTFFMRTHFPIWLNSWVAL